MAKTDIVEVPEYYETVLEESGDVSWTDTTLCDHQFLDGGDNDVIGATCTIGGSTFSGNPGDISRVCLIPGGTKTITKREAYTNLRNGKTACGVGAGGADIEVDSAGGEPFWKVDRQGYTSTTLDGFKRMLASYYVDEAIYFMGLGRSNSIQNVSTAGNPTTQGYKVIHNKNIGIEVPITVSLYDIRSSGDGGIPGTLEELPESLLEESFINYVEEGNGRGNWTTPCGWEGEAGEAFECPVSGESPDNCSVPLVQTDPEIQPGYDPTGGRGTIPFVKVFNDFASGNIGGISYSTELPNCDASLAGATINFSVEVLHECSDGTTGYTNDGCRSRVSVNGVPGAWGGETFSNASDTSNLWRPISKSGTADGNGCFSVATETESQFAWGNVNAFFRNPVLTANGAAIAPNVDGLSCNYVGLAGYNIAATAVDVADSDASLCRGEKKFYTGNYLLAGHTKASDPLAQMAIAFDKGLDKGCDNVDFWGKSCGTAEHVYPWVYEVGEQFSRMSAVGSNFTVAESGDLIISNKSGIDPLDDERIPHCDNATGEEDCVCETWRTDAKCQDPMLEFLGDLVPPQISGEFGRRADLGNQCTRIQLETDATEWGATTVEDSKTYKIKLDADSLVIADRNRGTHAITDFANEKSVCAAINANYFNTDISPIGLYGNEYYPCDQNCPNFSVNAAFAQADDFGDFPTIGQIGDIGIIDLVPFRDLGRDFDNDLNSSSRLRNGVSGFLIVSEGEVVENPAIALSVYTAIGITPSGEIFGYSSKHHADVLSDIMVRDGIEYGVLLDGGGSSQLYSEAGGINPSDGSPASTEEVFVPSPDISTPRDVPFFIGSTNCSTAGSSQSVCAEDYCSNGKAIPEGYEGLMKKVADFINSEPGGSKIPWEVIWGIAYNELWNRCPAGHVEWRQTADERIILPEIGVADGSGQIYEWTDKCTGDPNQLALHTDANEVDLQGKGVGQFKPGTFMAIARENYWYNESYREQNGIDTGEMLDRCIEYLGVDKNQGREDSSEQAAIDDNLQARVSRKRVGDSICAMAIMLAENAANDDGSGYVSAGNWTENTIEQAAQRYYGSCEYDYCFNAVNRANFAKDFFGDPTYDTDAICEAIPSDYSEALIPIEVDGAFTCPAASPTGHTCFQGPFGNYTHCYDPKDPKKTGNGSGGLPLDIFPFPWYENSDAIPDDLTVSEWEVSRRVVAPENGEVLEVGLDEPGEEHYGYVIRILGDSGITYNILHIDPNPNLLAVQAGNRVEVGQKIGEYAFNGEDAGGNPVPSKFANRYSASKFNLPNVHIHVTASYRGRVVDPYALYGEILGCNAVAPDTSQEWEDPVTDNNQCRYGERTGEDFYRLNDNYKMTGEYSSVCKTVENVVEYNELAEQINLIYSEESL